MLVFQVFHLQMVLCVFLVFCVFKLAGVKLDFGVLDPVGVVTNPLQSGSCITLASADTVCGLLQCSQLGRILAANDGTDDLLDQIAAFEGNFAVFQNAVAFCSGLGQRCIAFAHGSIEFQLSGHGGGLQQLLTNLGKPGFITLTLPVDGFPIVCIFLQDGSIHALGVAVELLLYLEKCFF